MASVLAGLARSAFGGGAFADPNNPATANETFLRTQLHPILDKLQKEIRGRRFKEFADFQEALKALKAFEKEEWPPKRKVASATKAKRPQQSALRKSQLQHSHEIVSCADTESTVSSLETEGNVTGTPLSAKVGDDSPTIYLDDETTAKDVALVEGEALQPADGAPVTLPQHQQNGGSVPESLSKPLVLQHEPQTLEEMHSSIVLLLGSLVEILESSYKTPKAIEYCLDAIGLLVSKRYVSGRAGSHEYLLNDTANNKEPIPYTSAPATISVENGSPPKAAPSLLSRVLEAVVKCSEQNAEAVHMALVKTMKSILTSPKCGVHESAMLLALRSVFHVFLVTKSVACKDLAKSSLQDMLRSVMGRMEAYDAIIRSHPESNGEVGKDANYVETEDTADGSGSTDSHKAPPFDSQYHADAYALFRSLCKMSSKELPAENEDEGERPTFFSLQAQSDPMSLHGKILSLELILQALDLSGDAFLNGERFIYLVQHYLCVSLLKNCVSNHTQVAFLSQKIFLVLVFRFKSHLKQEIEVFMSNVFLRVLESKNSSFKQKALVLESLRSVCSDPSLLAQIFLNYDCDFEGKNLYKDIVQVVTKFGSKATAMPSSSLAKKDAEQEFDLSLAGLEVLMSILRAFLKALNLPGGEDENKADSAGARIRGMLQLDVGLAAKAPVKRRDSADSVASLSLNGGERFSGISSSATVNSPVKVDSPKSNTAEHIVDAFELKRCAEQNLEIGLVKFSLSLKSGLMFFIEHGLVECNARSIAQFFLAHKSKLDKTQMGEALGREPYASFVKDETDADSGGPGFWVRILHYYVHNFDFTDLMFDEAIRVFLSGFRLPGEAQKIDRIMEKFAERFTAQNPEIFPSADTAFILAFSVIMLNTDLHNPSIKAEKRMTVEGFLRNNRGIGENGADLPVAFLTGIFNRIKERPFSLKEDDAARERAQKQVSEASVFFDSASLFGTSAEERRRERFKKERDEMMAVTQQLVRRRTEKKKSSRSSVNQLSKVVEPVDVVKPMFDVTWGPMLGILSQVLECSDDERSVALCLNGFVYAVRIASHSQMSLARDTFVTSLAKFTFLGSIKEMKKKNVESIRTLLSIAVIDGEYLGDSWSPVLQCISQIARMRLTASGLDSDESFLTIEQPKKILASSSRVEMFRAPSKLEVAREAEENNGKAVLEAVQEVLIDRVFSSTVLLSAKSLAHFIEQLIIVSNSEIEGNSRRGITGVESATNGEGTLSLSLKNDGPSLFSLQRLVDVASYNMDVRPRLVWSPIWHVMAEYFARIACHENFMVSVFAIDSLKQLSLKFLDKPELSEFNFQRIFLRPFLVVMENKGTTADNRELVLRCVDNIVRAKAHNFQSGWKVIFSVLRSSAIDPCNKIDHLGLSILQHLLDEHLDELCRFSDESTDSLDASRLSKRARNSNADDFVSLCKASLEFVDHKESDSPRPISLSMRALSHTAIYADLLANRRVKPPVSGAQCLDSNAPGYTYKGLHDDEALQMVLWRPLFEGLADGIRSSARSSAGGVGCLLQRASVLALRAILLRHGYQFSITQWAAILDQTFLFAMQDGARHDVSPVVNILSECPSISSIDFLVEALPLPPPLDDEQLLQFKTMQKPSLTRCLGEAEVMVEASFTDLRYGGDGDLRKAYALAKKVSDSAVKFEQPFPNSWIVTTAPIALGLLSDIVFEFIVRMGPLGREKLWPIIAKQFKLWCIGMPYDGLRQGNEHRSWRPCEALVRVVCREIGRLSKMLVAAIVTQSESERTYWAEALLSLLTQLTAESLQREEYSKQELISSKNKALLERQGTFRTEESLFNGIGEVMTTAFGRGIVKDWRKNCFKGSNGAIEITTLVITLEHGATLYQPQFRPLSQKSTLGAHGIPSEVTVPGAYWDKTIPELKIRCVAAYLLHQNVFGVLTKHLALVSQATVSTLLVALNTSQNLAENAVNDDDIATAFQESMVSDWGDGVDAVEQALESASRISHIQSNAMFFLAQEASATQATIHLLSLLHNGLCNDLWDCEGFAEMQMIRAMTIALKKFLESEEKEGHLVDPNVWHNSSESGGKVALYCTSFAVVVVDILKVIQQLRFDQFVKHKKELFPLICNLVRVQSDEIRHDVQLIFFSHVAKAIGVVMHKHGNTTFGEIA